jgi:hypothetical protein
MTTNLKTIAAAVALPPAAPYQTFKNAFRVFKTHGVPALVDNSALRRRFPPTHTRQILEALRFLDLINDAGEPSPTLISLVEAVDDEGWPDLLRKVLTATYAPVMEDGLENATPAQLNQRLRSSYGLEEDACRRSATFLLSAANDAHIPLSPYLLTPRRPKGRPNAHDLTEPNGDSGVADASEASIELLAAKLIEKFPEFDPKWSESLKEHWFSQFSELIQLVKNEDRAS